METKALTTKWWNLNQDFCYHISSALIHAFCGQLISLNVLHFCFIQHFLAANESQLFTTCVSWLWADKCILNFEGKIVPYKLYHSWQVSRICCLVSLSAWFGQSIINHLLGNSNLRNHVKFVKVLSSTYTV